MLCQGWSSICILFQGSVCCCKAEIAQARSYRARTASRASYNVLRLLLWMNQLLQSVARRVFSKFLSHLRCFWIELPSSLAPSPPPPTLTHSLPLPPPFPVRCFVAQAWCVAVQVASGNFVALSTRSVAVSASS